ncbi:hypothetical protein [Roseateles sp. BYS96W]|uniref:Uncharacterized protein n=1 Tax=Pelomonas nitida TaxID=3299027 RepID=A0ABW7G871_9BURK
MKLDWAAIATSKDNPPNEFRLEGGFLETVIATPKHPARSHLLWQNAFLGSRGRASIRAKQYSAGENSPLYLFPEMLDEVLKYVKVPKRLADGYREHRREIMADPSKSR